MFHFDPVPGLGQPLLHLFRNEHRAVLAAGTAERNCQVALTLANVVRNQVHQQVGDASDELAGLREGADVLGHLGWRPV